MDQYGGGAANPFGAPSGGGGYGQQSAGYDQSGGYGQNTGFTQSQADDGYGPGSAGVQQPYGTAARPRVDVEATGEVDPTL